MSKPPGMVIRAMAIALYCALSSASVALAQSSEEEALMRQVLSQLNLLSFKQGVEFCGYVGFDAQGNLAASEPTRGDQSSCLPDDPAKLDVVVASYHTHGDFSTEYSSETPSGDDMDSDEEEGVDGWVATPGGRLWYIDTEDMVTFQICGLGCLPQDPDFIEGDDGIIAEFYSYDDLIEHRE